MTEVAPRGGVPKKTAIADDLRRKIRTGEGGLLPGVVLPSEKQLADTYGVSRPTMREALGVLRSEGLIETSGGHGSVVTHRPIVRRLGDGRYTTMATPGINETPYTIDQGVGIDTARGMVDRHYEWGIPATPQVAARLHLPVGEPVLARHYFFWDANHQVPQQMGVSYVPMSIAADEQGRPRPGWAEENEPYPGGSIGSARAVGFRVTEVTEEIYVRLPYPEERDRLNIPPSVPVFEVHRVMRAGDVPVEAGLPFVIPGDRAVMVNTIRIP